MPGEFLEPNSSVGGTVRAVYSVPGSQLLLHETVINSVPGVFIFHSHPPSQPGALPVCSAVEYYDGGGRSVRADSTRNELHNIHASVVSASPASQQGQPANRNPNRIIPTAGTVTELTTSASAPQQSANVNDRFDALKRN